MDVQGRRFELTMASDVQADGMWLELDEMRGEDRESAAAVFYSDADGTMTFTGYQDGLPLAAIEWLVAEARRRLPHQSDAV